jgi:outer membrane protein TolC
MIPQRGSRRRARGSWRAAPRLSFSWRHVLLTTLACVLGSLLTALGVGCVPSRESIADPVAQAAQQRLGRPVSWRGANLDKDRAVDDAVNRRLAQVLSADAAVEIALVRHPAVQVAFSSLGLAQADVVDAGLLTNPRLSLGVAGVVEGGQTSGLDFDVGVEQSLLSLFFLAQRTSIAEARLDAARARALDVALGVAADARRAFVDAVASAQLAQLAHDELEAEEAIVLFLRENVAAGNQTRLDLAIAEVRYQEAVVFAGDAEREARVAREALLLALGLFGPASSLDLVRLPAQLGTPPVAYSKDLESAAVAANVSLSARRASLDAEAKALGLVSLARFLPDLDVGFDLGVEHHGSVAAGPSVGLTLPLFQQGQGEVLRRTAALSLQAALLAQDAVSLRTQARQAAIVVDNTVRRAEQLQRNLVPALSVVVDEMERRLNGMLVTPEPLLTARRAALRGSRALVLAERQAWHAVIDVEQLRQGGTPSGGERASPMSPDDSPGAAAPGAAGGH